MNSSCLSNCEPSAHTALGGRAANEYRVRSLSNSLESSFVSSTLSLYYLIIAKPPVLLTSRLCFARFGGGSPTEVFVFCNYRRNAGWTQMALSSLPFLCFCFSPFPPQQHYQVFVDSLSLSFQFFPCFFFPFQFFLSLFSFSSSFSLLSPAGNMLSRGMQALFAGLFLEAITADTLPSCCLIRQSINAGGR